jgi:hypothetical protein
VCKNGPKGVHSQTSSVREFLATKHIQWNLDLSFFKGVEKTNDEYGETNNQKNHFFKQKSRTFSFADGA